MYTAFLVTLRLKNPEIIKYKFLFNVNIVTNVYESLTVTSTMLVNWMNQEVDGQQTAIVTLCLDSDSMCTLS